MKDGYELCLFTNFGFTETSLGLSVPYIQDAASSGSYTVPITYDVSVYIDEDDDYVRPEGQVYIAWYDTGYSRANYFNSTENLYDTIEGKVYTNIETYVGSYQRPSFTDIDLWIYLGSISGNYSSEPRVYFRIKDLTIGGKRVKFSDSCNFDPANSYWGQNIFT